MKDIQYTHGLTKITFTAATLAGRAVFTKCFDVAATRVALPWATAQHFIAYARQNGATLSVGWAGPRYYTLGQLIRNQIATFRAWLRFGKDSKPLCCQRCGGRLIVTYRGHIFCKDCQLEHTP